MFQVNIVQSLKEDVTHVLTNVEVISVMEKNSLQRKRYWRCFECGFKTKVVSESDEHQKLGGHFMVFHPCSVEQ